MQSEDTDEFVNMLGIAARATSKSQPVGKFDTSPSLVQTPSKARFMAFCCYIFI